MGTSSQFGGTTVGLVPSWVDDPTPAPADSEKGKETVQNPLENTTETPDKIRTLPFQGAKANYSRYLRSGDQRSMNNALKSYGKATGGTGGATRRMGTSRTTAGGLAHFIGALGTGGAQQAIREFNLSNYAGQSASDVLFALSEVICPPGGTIDEGIARDAMHESIGELINSGITDLDSMNEAQRQELLINYFTHSIQGRIVNDIGHGTVKIPSSNEEVERLEKSLAQFTKGLVRVAVERHFKEKSVFNQNEMAHIIDNIYQESFALLTGLAEVLK
ncbi:hypothetical protein Sulku_2589 (plasmid) [Sulfuricurvum kujiense DSM 16994]|uniref:Uncharacterized protein n=1 Tax=Sulfuricurvum kujiense (strain ATCC BAA-921 / DSM 16994 / JCM 11577 / YK-1) TaxID=709032 RepID=E4U3H8_SULKY|nr:Qat anti-phage system associated protein QatB [Sulfuricurvum kujiense]ADR35244.1 hypothetical protein Sulku_2589 [Sulfuricurvum kujiense DSM 16994]